MIRELAAVSPSPYIHIGGDEALSTTLVDYVTFMERVMPIVANYGKRVMGWNEITKAETVGDLVAQYWATGTSDFSVAAAVQRGGKVLMSPANKAYLDMKYDESTPYGLTWAGYIEVRTASNGIRRAPRRSTRDRGLGRGGPAVVGDSQSDRPGGVHDVPPIARARRGRLVTPERPRVERLPPAPGKPRPPLGGDGPHLLPLTPDSLAAQPQPGAGPAGDGVQHRGCAVPRVGRGGRQPHHPLVFRLLRPAVDFD